MDDSTNPRDEAPGNTPGSDKDVKKGKEQVVYFDGTEEFMTVVIHVPP
ncbi:hypothetical protein CENSYa_0552 [Cenarchaeum symbiosum A]|uniref:Uncharacterized protein n=1 Tax=Cenarchaeum symbiosum (strain A) TaxID=414004 RepID=A0RV18_CENSY|nr:hypothetical protein CENSYa_0552 [Cenarchaeum symbiosum A]